MVQSAALTLAASLWLLYLFFAMIWVFVANAAIECIKVLDLEKKTEMADAGVATQPFLNQVVEQKGDYLVPVKGDL
jgi:hypothetical protein